MAEQGKWITSGETVSATFTGDGVLLFHRMAQRAAIGLEAKGIRHSRGSVTARVKRQLGVRGNRDKVLAALDAEIARIKAALPPGAIR